ncbi:hypothetical protein [Candidatus Rickettsia kedanie]
MSFPRGIVAWISFLLSFRDLIAGSKILKLLVFWIPWSSHGMTPNGFFGPRNNAYSQ